MTTPELCSLSISESPVAVSELPALADPEHAVTAVSGVSSLEPSVPVLEPSVSVLQPVMIVSEPCVSIQEPTVAVSEPAVIVSEHTQITSPEMAVESSPVMVESSVVSSQIMKGMNLLSGDENLGSEVGTQETLLHPGEEPHDGGHLKSDLYEHEYDRNTDLTVNSHLIAKEAEHSTACAAAIVPVGETSEEKILPISETKEMIELDTCPAVSEADIGRSLSSQLALELDTVGTSKGFEFVAASAPISESKYDVEVSVTTQDTEHDMVISTSPSGGSEADIEGPLPAKDIHLDLPSTNLVCKDVEDSLPIKESDETVTVALSPKESSEDTEGPLPNKEIVPDSGYSVSIDEINEADLVRPLLPKDMERLTSLRAGIEGPLLPSEVERDKSVASPVVISIPERASESSSEEKDDYEIFVKVKDTHEKSKKNKNRDKGEKEKKGTLH